ncbi:MAG: response regulator [Nitrospiraceae bacterium]|nr:response regulator [Nitrospiraceae bacterium]
MERDSEDQLGEMKLLVDFQDTTAALVRQLRIPISSIIRYAGLIGSESRENAVRKYAEDLYREAMSASEMLDTVISSGMKKNDPSCLVDVNALLTQTVSLFRYQMRTKGILPVILLAEEALPFKGDLFRLQRAFYIVLLNAVQLLVDAGGEKKITLSSRSEEARIKIDVSVDTPGSVIPGETDPLKLFFAAIDKGMGLGWYTLRKNIAELGGNVTMAAGPGFVFTIELPCATGDAVAKTSAGPRSSDDAPACRRVVVLVIDDEEIAGKVTAEMLDYLGFETVRTDDPIAALPLLKERRFDLVMVDYQLPKINGETFIREYISLLKDSHVVLMTGDSSLSVPPIAGARKVGLLKKPFGLKELARLAEDVRAGIRPETC